MRWFLKCFYWYRNLWDELLFWWILDYIDTAYTTVDELTIEVADVEWMQTRWTRNSGFLQDLKIAQGFISQQKIIKFVEISKDIRDNFKYDIYFFWWGEVFAESRGFHGGRNYLLRYAWAIHMKPFVLLGGIETPTQFRQKTLYKYLLPKADKIICREESSYKVAHHYNKKSQLFTDFAVPVIDKYRHMISAHHTQTLTSHDTYDLQKISQLVGKKYIVLNMIASMSTDESYVLIEKFIAQYPDHTMVYVGATSDDTYYATWLQGVYPEMIVYDWKEYSLVQILSLFQHAQAGIGCRLHFLLLLQEFHRDRYALVYAEKVKKLITSTITLS